MKHKSFLICLTLVSSVAFGLGDKIHVFDINDSMDSKNPAKTIQATSPNIDARAGEVVEKDKVKLYLKNTITSRESEFRIRDLISECSDVDVCKRFGHHRVLTIPTELKYFRPQLRTLKKDIAAVFPPGTIEVRGTDLRISRPLNSISAKKIKESLMTAVELPSSYDHCEVGVERIDVPFDKKIFVDKEVYSILNRNKFRIQANRTLPTNSQVVKVMVGESRKERIDVRAQLSFRCPQLLLGSFVRKDQIVTESDFYTSMGSVRRLQPLQDVTSWIGLQAVRNLEPGAIANRRLFKAAKYVRNRRISDLQVENGALRLSLKVLPLRDGELGETIPVKVKQFKKELFATVIGRDQLSVNLKQVGSL